MYEEYRRNHRRRWRWLLWLLMGSGITLMLIGLVLLGPQPFKGQVGIVLVILGSVVAGGLRAAELG